jgi:hypothetical protein
MIALIDTVTPGDLRGFSEGDAFAGYVAGSFADLATIERDYPGHRFVSVTPDPDDVAEFCDCETGDLVAAQVIPWILRMHKGGIWRPGVYADAARLPEVLPDLARKLPRTLYRVWGADWNGEANVPEGWDAHQYENDKARDVDLSVCLDSFFPTLSPPKPKPAPVKPPAEEAYSARVTLVRKGADNKWAVDKL